MKANFQLPKAGVKGYYRIQKLRKGEVVYDSGDFPNLITNSGLNYLAASTGWLSTCRVGTGTTAPAFTDANLETEIASVTNANNYDGTTTRTVFNTDAIGSIYYTANRRTYNFAEGAAVGNISEVAIGPSTGNVFSRALIVDGAGNPTTITLLADESLRVFHELRLYPPVGDNVHTVGAYTVTTRAYRTDAQSADGWAFSPRSDSAAYTYTQNFAPSQFASNTFLAVNSATGLTSYTGNLGTGSPLQNPTVAGYSSDSYTRTYTAVFSPATGNLDFAMFIFAIGFTGWQIHVSPNIVKSDLEELTVGLSISWGRYVEPV